MLNRNDRSALRRNRNAVSWLCLLCIILSVWIKILYGDISEFSNNNNSIRIELDSTQALCNNRRFIIDSLMSVINHKNVDTSKTSTEPKKESTFVKVKVDSVKKDVRTKVDSIRPSRKDTILKDTLKLN